jgi:SAM-dependent methyltransferase
MSETKEKSDAPGDRQPGSTDGARAAGSTPEPRRRRRALTNVGGAIDASGDRKAREALAYALDVAPAERGERGASREDARPSPPPEGGRATERQEDAPDRAHVHGFHAYPGRAHPVTARRLVEAFVGTASSIPRSGATPAFGGSSTRAEVTLLDPFCGSGTILVEAMLAGRNVIGTDLNPLAVMLARAKTYAHSEAQREALLESARAVAAFAEARRKAKAGATKRLPAEDVALFAPHVLLELDSIRAGIAKEAKPAAAVELGLVLSSILVKLSQKRGDTSEEVEKKRLAAGYATRLFVLRTEELARRFGEFTALLADSRVRARVFLDDATVLKKVAPASVDAIVTSPPYAGTYDYVAHHALRMRWLGLDARGFAGGELGARRSYERLAPLAALEAWRRELGKLFASFARVVKPGGNVVLLLADSATARGPRGEAPIALRADALVAEVARREGHFAPVARASQARPHFHGPTAEAFRGQARAEHAILLRRG